MKERNVLFILINKENKFLVENENSTLYNAIKDVENFINGKPVLNSQKFGQEYREKEIGNFGHAKIPKGVIGILYDAATDKKVINQLLRGIGEKYIALRQEKAESFFHRDYFNLETGQKKIIDEIVPIRISYAYKKIIAPSPPPPPPPAKSQDVTPPPPPPAKTN